MTAWKLGLARNVFSCEQGMQCQNLTREAPMCLVYTCRLGCYKIVNFILEDVMCLWYTCRLGCYKTPNFILEDAMCLGYTCRLGC